MRKFTIITVIVSLFVINACNNDFMERYPPDKISDMNYWKTASDLQLFANQFYPSLFDARVAWYTDDYYSDNQAPSNLSRVAFIWNQYTVPATGGGWAKGDWKPIRDCNYALVRAAEMDKTADILSAEAEIRFFKTFFYFKKVKRFGDVPWLVADLQTDSEELYQPRDSRKLVIEKMLEDLDFAIANLPATSSSDRLTKYAALALKAEICLYEGTFRKYHKVAGGENELLRLGAQACESIINSGLFSVWSTGNPNSDYFDLFVQYELQGNPEGIMIQQYITNKRMHNNVRQLGEPHGGLTKDFVKTYLCKDGLPISLSPLYQGDAEFMDEFIDRDPRMKQSIYTPDRPYRIYDNGSVAYRTMPDYHSTNCFTGYKGTKGYSPYERDRIPSTSTTDDFIFRYGKLLLDYAEIKAELGECTQEILDLTVNALRDRVAMPHLTVDVGFVDPNWPDWEIPISPLLNEIRRERRIETYFEGRRWDDLVRWKAGKLLENKETFLGARDPATGEYRILYPNYPERKWDDKLYLYPLPIEEMVLNENLTQNPGW
ncbi:MAG: RagB/SusD family nutrient uptake outer membrane protein [Fermentimonas sp.]